MSVSYTHLDVYKRQPIGQNFTPSIAVAILSISCYCYTNRVLYTLVTVVYLFPSPCGSTLVILADRHPVLHITKGLYDFPLSPYLPALRETVVPTVPH